MLDSLDFTYYQELFTKLMGRRSCMAVLDEQGNMLWTLEEGQGDDLRRILNGMEEDILTRIRKEGGMGVKRVTAGDGAVLVMQCVQDENESPLGWLVANAGAADEAGLERLEENFRTIARGVAREAGLQRDLTDLTAELAGRYDELQIFYDLKEILNGSHRGDDVLREILQLSYRCFDADLALLFISERERAQYIKKNGIAITSLDLLITKLRSDIFRFVSSSKSALVINRMEDRRRAFLCVGMAYKLLAAPILIGNTVKGLIALSREQGRDDFLASDRRLLEVLAEQTAILMKNQEMYGALQLFTEQIANALIRAVDAKDPYTHGHSIRVNQYAVELGRALRLSDEDLQSLYWSSLLHDLGKIGVPDSVLGKLGRLNDDEYTLIKIHPERGYDILQNVERLMPALPGIRHHHERYDGKGYPFGLEGKSIPLHARIIAVADTYDAITSSRSYREARSWRDALEEIGRVAGAQLDPDVVETWVKVVYEKGGGTSSGGILAEAINE